MGIKSLKNISYRIYAFFITLLCFSLSSIIFFTQDNEIHAAIGKEVPYTQHTQAVSSGTKALRYESHEEIYDLFINQVNQTLHEYMYAPFVHSQNRIYTFSQGVNYLRLDGLNFWSNWEVIITTHAFLQARAISRLIMPQRTQLERIFTIMPCKIYLKQIL